MNAKFQDWITIHPMAFAALTFVAGVLVGLMF
jgi:hypothetical protein